MKTHDAITIAAPKDRCFEVAADVERWPDILPHYRWVRFRRKDGFGCGLVEMAARREFGPIPYPVWWVSEMSVDPQEPVVRYRHVEGITTGMDVAWSFRDSPGGSRVEIVHTWPAGPGWPVIGRLAADVVIGPVFIHNVASKTLAGVKRAVEESWS